MGQPICARFVFARWSLNLLINYLNLKFCAVICQYVHGIVYPACSKRPMTSEGRQYRLIEPDTESSLSMGLLFSTKSLPLLTEQTVFQRSFRFKPWLCIPEVLRMLREIYRCYCRYDCWFGQHGETRQSVKQAPADQRTRGTWPWIGSWISLAGKKSETHNASWTSLNWNFVTWYIISKLYHGNKEFEQINWAVKHTNSKRIS